MNAPNVISGYFFVADKKTPSIKIARQTFSAMNQKVFGKVSIKKSGTRNKNRFVNTAAFNG